MTYWCPISQDYTDPPRLKRDSRRRRGKRMSLTHALHDGKALCSKKSPALFNWPDEKPTCPKCLALLEQGE